MRRRDFMALAGGAAVMAASSPLSRAIAGHAVRAPAVHTKRRFVMGCAVPRSAGGTYDRAARLAGRLAGKLGDAVVIDVATVDVGSRAAFAAGRADMMFAAECENVDEAPALAFFCGLPGRFASAPAAAEAWLSAAGEHVWRRAHGQIALRPIYAGTEGTRPSLWSRQKLESLAGINIATASTLHAEVAAALGATVVALQPSAYAAALDDGVVDAVEVSSIEDALALGIVGIARYCLDGALAPHAGPVALTCAPAVLKSVPMLGSLAVREDVWEFARLTRTESERNHLALRAAVAASRYCQFDAPSGDLRNAVDRLAEAVLADYASRDDACREAGGITMAALRFGGKQIAL